MIEKREHSRVEIQIDVNYKNLDIFHRNTILNISQNGVFIKTHSPLPLGTEITLEFTLPSQTQSIRAKGQVVWHHKKTRSTISSQEPGMGIRLQEITPQDLQCIKNYVSQILAEKK